ncbi:MAG: type II toxin-antitoxin system HicB family antitoxin [Lachnospiraceae bacterium]|nr:type II toxin-antitoxin system HicB family antitoxin [Lachnospiraceae bacterium]
MKNVYPVIFTQLDDKKETVLVEIPDWSIMTEGFGMADAMYMARDAIGLKGIKYEDDGKDIPEPSDLSAVDVSQGTFACEGESFVSLVDIDFAEYRRRADNKTVRRNVTIPCWLNQEAEKAHINVSRVLQEALMAKLNVSR